MTEILFLVLLVVTTAASAGIIAYQAGHLHGYAEGVSDTYKELQG